jgi:hypothetical protein
LTDGNDVGGSNVNMETVNNEKPLIAYPSQLKEKMDDTVSVSISVVQGNEQVSGVSESEDSDVVTVTRIPQERTENKPLQDLINSTHEPLVSKAEGVIQSKFRASGKRRKSEKIIAIPDRLQVIPLKANTNISEHTYAHTVKMDDVLGFHSKSEKEVNDMSPDNLGTVGRLKKSSDKSVGFLRFPNMQKKGKSGDSTTNAGIEDIILEEPDKSVTKSLDVKHTVPDSAKTLIDCSEENSVGCPVPNLSGVCYTVMPSKRKRISISVDSKRIRTSTSHGVRSNTDIQDTNFIFQNVQKFKLKQQVLGLSSSGNLIVANNVKNVEGSSPKNIQVYELSRNVQKNCVKPENIAEKEVAANNPASVANPENIAEKDVAVKNPVSVAEPENIAEKDVAVKDPISVVKPENIAEKDVSAKNLVTVAEPENIAVKDPVTVAKPIAEKDIAVKKPITDLSAPMSISKSPNANDTIFVSYPSLKRGILQGQSSDIKYVVYDNSKSRLVPASVTSGNKMGYHVITSSEVGRNKDALPYSGAAQKTALGHKKTGTPLFVTIVACANATGTTSSVSTSKVKNVMPPAASRNQRTKQVGPQVGNSAYFFFGLMSQIIHGPAHHASIEPQS